MTTTIALKATSEASPLFCEQKACESEYGTTASSDFDEEIAEDVSKHKGTLAMQFFSLIMIIIPYACLIFT